MRFITLKTEQLQYMFCFYLFRNFAPIFHFKLFSFYDGERKNISCPRAQGTLATPLVGHMPVGEVTWGCGNRREEINIQKYVKTFLCSLHFLV